METDSARIAIAPAPTETMRDVRPLSRAWKTIAAALALGVIAIHGAVIYPWMPDDAFITFRYAENLAAGSGPVFNPGERVEGYTSFLWVLMLAGARALGVDTVVAARLLGSVFALLTVLLVLNAYRLAVRIDERTCVAAVLMLGSCGVFTPWAMSGMEVTLFTFLVLLATLLCLSLERSLGGGRASPSGMRALTQGDTGEAQGVRASAHRRAEDANGRAGAGDTALDEGLRVSTPEGGLVLRGASSLRFAAVGAVCGLSALARPEGCLVFAVIAAYLAAVHGARRARALLALTGAFGAVFLPYLLWRVLYYGYPLPNTFYAKVGFHLRQLLRGANYGMGFITVAALVLAPIFVALLSRGRLQGRRDLGLLIALAAAYSAYIVAVGGDGLAAYRFFAPLIPLLCLAAAACAGLLLPARSLGPFVAAVFLYNIVQMNVGYGIHLHLANDRVAREGTEVGLWLRDHAPPGAEIAMNAAGAIPYFSRLKAIDMLGLNDTHIAHRDMPRMGEGMPGHEKGDGAYVLSLSPYYIEFGSALGSKEPVFIGDKEIDRDPGFHERYALAVHTLPSGKSFTIYERK